MTKKVLKIFALAMSFMIVATLAVCAVGCTIKHKRSEIKTDGSFLYILVGENGGAWDRDTPVVAIVGFPSSAETIDIPQEIDGYPVRYIGFLDENFLYNDSIYVVCGENLKKIYVYDNIKEIVYFDEPNVELMVCSNNFNIHFGVGVQLKNAYMYHSVYESGHYSYDGSVANIVFMNNYSDEVNGGYYRLDNIEKGEKIPEPPAPKREGYEFTGWYTEAECVNEWNFDVSPTIEEETEFRLYAGWRNL